MSELYENIKLVCAAHGESVSGVAIKSGVSKSTISQLKNGTTQSLNMATLKKMADYLGEPISVLLGQKNDTPENEDVDEMIEILKFRPEMRMLFSVAKNATSDDIKRAVKIIEALKNE